MRDFSIVIPCDDGSERREINQWVQNWYRRTYEGREVIVSVSEGQPFNKSVAINRGVLRASCDLLVIVDSDTMIVPEQLAKGINDDWTIPFNRVLNLTQAATCRCLEDGIVFADLQPDDVEHIREGFVRAGGVWIVSRAIFEEVGGCDERYAGWGGEDDSFCRAANTLVKHLRIVPGDVYHLWHPPNPGRNDFQQRPNYRLWRRYCRATGKPEYMRALVDEGQIPVHRNAAHAV